MRWPIIGALLSALIACSSSHTPLEDRVAIATLDAWSESGMPPPLEECRLEAFRFEHPETLLSFQKACSAPGADPTKLRAWACLRWRLEAPRARSLRYPAAVLHPDLAEESWGAAGVHEMMHALIHCSSLLHKPGDSYDYLHSNPAVWEAAGGADSVQALAMRKLEVYDGVPAWPPNLDAQ